MFLDDPLFASRIREWLKTLRKKNVAVIFATQSLADIADSQIAPAIIESCPSRIFLPNPRALEPTQTETYRRFGLNDTQVRLIAEAVPANATYLQSRAGNRPCLSLASDRSRSALVAASSPEDQRPDIGPGRRTGPHHFAERYLAERGLHWAAELDQHLRTGPQGLTSILTSRTGSYHAEDNRHACSRAKRSRSHGNGQSIFRHRT